MAFSKSYHIQTTQFPVLEDTKLCFVITNTLFPNEAIFIPNGRVIRLDQLFVMSNTNLFKQKKKKTLTCG